MRLTLRAIPLAAVPSLASLQAALEGGTLRVTLADQLRKLALLVPIDAAIKHGTPQRPSGCSRSPRRRFEGWV
jgi:hypothetical protein